MSIHIPHKASQRMAAWLLCILGTIGSVGMGVNAANAAQLDSSLSGVHKVEEGIVVNMNDLLQSDASAVRVDDMQTIPTWQNPAYAAASTTQGASTKSVAKSVCTSSNYRVVSTLAPDRLGNSYYYTCWAGTGTYSQATPMGQYGSAGVSLLCPGNTRGAILQQTLWDTNNYSWSPTRGPYPNNTADMDSAYCHKFPSLRVYTAVRLS